MTNRPHPALLPILGVFAVLAAAPPAMAAPAPTEAAADRYAISDRAPYVRRHRSHARRYDNECCDNRAFDGRYGGWSSSPGWDGSSGFIPGYANGS